MARLVAAALAILTLGYFCEGLQNVADTARGANGTQFANLLEDAINQGAIDLSTGGPYTVLVPTDDAFAKLTQAELEEVGNADLGEVVGYHVIKGEIFSWDLLNGRLVHTVNGHDIRVYATGQSIYLNNGRVVRPDLETHNAVLHFIDTVLDVPEGTIYAVARSGQYPTSTFADFADKAGVNRTLDSVGRTKYTVFVPSNDAFARLSPIILDHISTSSTYLRELVLYHIHAGTLHLQSLDRNSTISTLDNRHKIQITVDTDVHLNHLAELEEADIDCDNGVLHIIDHVLIPSSIGNIIG